VSLIPNFGGHVERQAADARKRAGALRTTALIQSMILVGWGKDRLEGKLRR
jgi:hypothetical protein